MRKVKLILSASLLLLLFGVFPLSVRAFSLQDISNSMRNLLGGENNKPEEKSLAIDSSIALLKGNSISFSLTITNPTQNTFHFATLKTNINSENIHSIRNLHGTLNLSEQDKTIIIPNLTIKPNQVRLISFESQIIFNQESDLTISVEPELIDEKNASIFKAQKQEITAKKSETENINKILEITE